MISYISYRAKPDKYSSYSLGILEINKTARNFACEKQ